MLLVSDAFLGRLLLLVLFVAILLLLLSNLRASGSRLQRRFFRPPFLSDFDLPPHRLGSG